MRVSGTQVTATQNVAHLNLNGPHLIISNDGLKTIYLRIEQGQDIKGVPTAVATSEFPLASGEVLQMDSKVNFRAVHYVCAAGETCVMRYICWH